MRAFVLRLLSGALVVSASCIGRVGEGTEARVEVPDDDRGQDDGARVVDRDGGASANCTERPLAAGLRIREVALYQAVKVPLYHEGEWIEAQTRNAAIVRGKQGLVRTFVDILPGYKPHSVRAVLRLRDGDKVTEVFDTKTVGESSRDEALETSFNFDLKGAQLGADTELSVALEELSCKSRSGTPAEARVPAEDFLPLEAVPIDPLKVVIVPITVEGRTPPVDPVELETLRSTLLAFFPVPEVEVKVDPPVEWESPIEPTDSRSWSDLLSHLMRMRQQASVGRDVYYLGLVQPATNYRSYCENGCILGLAPQTVRRHEAMQVALSASFTTTLTYETMVHELGHAHGRGHTPCSLGTSVVQVDQYYPVDDGSTDGWGWDFRHRTLKAPNEYKDVMGYCEPNWISAYNYSALAERSMEVNGVPFAQGLDTTSSLQNLILYADGGARWGSVIEANLLAGDSEPAEVLDAKGAVVRRIDVLRVPLSHTADQFLYVPPPEASWSAIRLKDRVVQLSSVLPAR